MTLYVWKRKKEKRKEQQQQELLMQEGKPANHMFWSSSFCNFSHTDYLGS